VGGERGLGVVRTYGHHCQAPHPLCLIVFVLTVIAIEIVMPWVFNQSQGSPPARGPAVSDCEYLRGLNAGQNALANRAERFR
jgi:hypothetical protein